MKMKLFMPLAVILVMGMATSAFAQLSCSVASTPVSRATATGHAEQAGDLIFNCAGGGTPTTAATITVSYGVTITNNAALPVARPIAITGATGTFAAATPTVTSGSISNATGQVVITVPANPATAGTTNSFSLVGVLVSLNGTGFTSLSANVSVSPGNGVLITAGQDVATVVTAILPGLNTTTAPPALLTGTLPALYFSSSAVAVPGRGAFTFTVTENYIDMFRDSTQYAGSTNDTLIQITLTGMPTGTSITGCTASITGGATTINVNGVVTPGSATITAASPVITLGFDGPTNSTAIETIVTSCTGFTAPAGALPLSATITGAVTLAPTGTALNGTVVHTGGAAAVPRYQSSTSSLGTLLSFTPNTTTMIVPFAMGDPSLTAAPGTFDTGIALANTTADTIGGVSIFSTGGAVAQAGTITYHFFPSSGIAADRFSITVGNQISGASYIANVSEILRTGGRTVSFTGYIIIVTNFTNAHGTAFIYGGNCGGTVGGGSVTSACGRLTSQTDLLVIPSPVASPRSLAGGLGALVEPTSK